MKELTEKQKAILEYMTDNLQVVFPTYRDIAHKFGFTVKGAWDHVKAIKKKGYLDKIQAQWRRAAR